MSDIDEGFEPALEKPGDGKLERLESRIERLEAQIEELESWRDYIDEMRRDSASE